MEIDPFNPPLAIGTGKPRCSSDVAAEVLGWEGLIVEGVEGADQKVDVIVRPNQRELERRGDTASPILDRSVLRALMELPLGVEVPWNSLKTTDTLVLRLCGDALVQSTAAGVHRVFEPAFDLVGIVAADDALSANISRVTLFGAHAPRAAVGALRSCRRYLATSQRAGVGLVAYDGSEAWVFSSPDRSRVRATSARWRFAELTYKRWLETVSPSPAMS